MQARLSILFLCFFCGGRSPRWGRSAAKTECPA